MIQDFLAVKHWTNDTIGKFYGSLREYGEDEKCESTVFVAQALQKRGDDSRLIAEAILLYAEDNFVHNVTAEARARVFWALGELYENTFLDYAKAAEQYLQWRNLNSSVSGANRALARTVLLRDAFKYTAELEEYYLAGYGEADSGSRNERLYDAICGYIVNSFRGEKEKTLNYRAQAQAIVKADETFFADFVLRIDGTNDKLTVPRKVRIFVKEMEKPE